MMISGVALTLVTCLLIQWIAKKWWQKDISQNYTHTHKYKEPVLPKLLNKVPNVLEVCDAIQKCQVRSLGQIQEFKHITNKLTMWHMRIIWISQVRKIKTATIGIIYNSLLVNVMLVKDLQPKWSTIYCLQTQRGSRTSHHWINTQYYLGRRRRRQFLPVDWQV